MAPPPRKRARYLSDDEDDEHIAADDALFARWRARIYPDLLKLLFRAGYKTEEALSSLEHTDLAAAAGFLGVRVKPGLVRSWDVFMRAKNGASTTVPTEPRAAAGASVSEVVRAAAIATGMSAVEAVVWVPDLLCMCSTVAGGCAAIFRS